MGHASTGIAVAVFFAAAVGGINGFVHRQNDVGNSNLGSFLGQCVTAAWTAGRFHQLMAAKFAKKML
jgi:hypothetical protein